MLTPRSSPITVTVHGVPETTWTAIDAAVRTAYSDREHVTVGFLSPAPGAPPQDVVLTISDYFYPNAAEVAKRQESLERALAKARVVPKERALALLIENRHPTAEYERLRNHLRVLRPSHTDRMPAPAD